MNAPDNQQIAASLARIADALEVIALTVGRAAFVKGAPIGLLDDLPEIPLDEWKRAVQIIGEKRDAALRRLAER